LKPQKENESICDILGLLRSYKGLKLITAMPKTPKTESLLRSYKGLKPGTLNITFSLFATLVYYVPIRD